MASEMEKERCIPATYTAVTPEQVQKAKDQHKIWMQQRDDDFEVFKQELVESGKSLSDFKTRYLLMRRTQDLSFEKTQLLVLSNSTTTNICLSG